MMMLKKSRLNVCKLLKKLSGEVKVVQLPAYHTTFTILENSIIVQFVVAL